ncbi:hypothetical protein ACPA9J_13050 [Pseudomonas aeruginosa]
MRTQLVRPTFFPSSPGLSRRHLAALCLRGFGFASRLSRRLPQRPDGCAHATRERLLLGCAAAGTPPTCRIATAWPCRLPPPG